MFEQTLRIKKFDLNIMCDHPTIVINAKRGSGKSVCIKHLMYYYHTVKKYPIAIVCSNSEKVDPYYKNFCPDLFIYEDCVKAFNKILIRQKKIKSKNEKIKAGEEQGEIEDGRLLLVLDDVLANAKEWTKSQDMSEIIYNGRHYDITLIIAVQDIVALGPGIRNNIDYVFLFNNDIKVEVEKMWKYYAGIFDSCRTFQEVLNQVTEDYGILVINRRNPESNNLVDKIGRFKAQYNLPPFMFGSEKTIKYAKKHYDKNWFDRQNELQEKYNMVGKKLNHTIVKLEK